MTMRDSDTGLPFWHAFALAVVMAVCIIAISTFAINAILALVHPDCVPHVTHGAALHCVRL